MNDRQNILNLHDRAKKFLIKADSQQNEESLGLIKELINSQSVLLQNDTIQYNELKEQKEQLHAAFEELRNINETLVANELRYQNILDYQEELIVCYEPNHSITFINKTYCNYLHKSREELETSVYQPPFLDEDIPSALAAEMQITPESPVQHFEARHMTASGELRWHRWNVRGFFDEYNNLVEYQAVGNDISEIILARQKAEYNTRRFQTIIDALPMPVFYKNTKGQYLGCNRAFEQIMGLSRLQIVNKTIFDIATKELAQIYHEMDEKLFQKKSQQVYESKIRFADGHHYPVRFHKAVFGDGQGRISGLVGVLVVYPEDAGNVDLSTV